MRRYDAVVLAGGGGRRLGGVDKPGLLVGGLTLLDRVLAALPDAGTVVVVGPPRPVGRPVVWAREEPPGGGPAAALAAGLAVVDAPAVVVLAADLPFLSVEVVTALRAAAEGGDGALVVDDDGREQVLTSCWTTDRLRERAVGDLDGAPLRALLRGLTPVRLPVGSLPVGSLPVGSLPVGSEPVGAQSSDRRPGEPPAHGSLPPRPLPPGSPARGPSPVADVDTPDDLARARAVYGGPGTGEPDAG